MTEKEIGCDNCYYSYFDEKAYPCSLCIRGIERTDMWQPSKKTKADRKTEPTHEIRTETHECVKDTHNKTEPQEGKWIAKTENYHSHWVCSECGAWALLEYNEQQCLSNFCPDCGARMKGVDDD